MSTGCAHNASLEVAGFAVSTITFPSGLYLAPHCHSRPCVSVLLEGSFEERQGSRNYTLGAASVLSKPAGEPHDDLFHDAGARVLVVQPIGTPRLGAGGALLEQPISFRDHAITMLAWRILGELERPDALSPLAVEGQVLELLALGARRVGQGQRVASPRWLERARAMIHDRFADQLRVIDIAAEVEVHPDHLARVFRAQLGVSIPTYVRGLRLDWAAHQLATTDRPLKEIAHAAGFCDQSHLTRCFKQRMGVTPSLYRNAVRAERTRHPGWRAPRPTGF